MRYLMMMLLSVGCGSSPAPAPASVSEPASASGGDQENATCGDFRFGLGEYAETESTEPNEESPVSFSAGSQPLTLHFQCDGNAQDVSLGELESSCQGAGCGSEITVRNGQVEVYDPQEVLTEAETAGVTTGAPQGTVFTWWIASQVGRALIQGDTFDIIETAAGFTVLRREDSETLYTHP